MDAYGLQSEEGISFTGAVTTRANFNPDRKCAATSAPPPPFHVNLPSARLRALDARGMEGSINFSIDYADIRMLNLDYTTHCKYDGKPAGPKSLKLTETPWSVTVSAAGTEIGKLDTPLSRGRARCFVLAAINGGAHDFRDSVCNESDGLVDEDAVEIFASAYERAGNGADARRVRAEAPFPACLSSLPGWQYALVPIFACLLAAFGLLKTVRTAHAKRPPTSHGIQLDTVRREPASPGAERPVAPEKALDCERLSGCGTSAESEEPWKSIREFALSFLLAVDLLLPDFVDLQVRKKYENDLGNMEGVPLAGLFIYRIAGWAYATWLVSLLL